MKSSLNHTVRSTRSRFLRKRRRMPPKQPFAHNNKAWLVWGISAIFVLFQFFLQLSSGQLIGGLMKSFSLTALGGGVLASSYYYIYVLLQSPAGMLIDRYGPRRLLSVGATIVMIGCLIFSLAPNSYIAVLGRLMMGAGAAFAFVGSLNIISLWFPANRFGFMTAMAETFGMLGSIFGSVVLAVSVHHYGWRSCILFAAGLSALIAVLIWTIVRDRPENVTLITSRSTDSWLADTKYLICSKLSWMNGIYSGLLFAIISVFISLWAVPFFQSVYGFSLVQSTLMCNMTFIGVAIGSPLAGWLDGHYCCRRILMVAGPSLAACCLSLICFDSSGLNIVSLACLMGGMGFFISVYVLNFVIGNQTAKPGMRGANIGFVNMCSVGTAPILGPLLGWIIDLSSKHVTTVAEHAHLMMVGYEESFSILIAGLLLAAWIGCYLPKKHKKVHEEDVKNEAINDIDSDSSLPHGLASNSPLLNSEDTDE